MATIKEQMCKHHGITIFVYRTSENTYRCRQCSVAAVDKRRRRVKQLAVEHKGGKCESCGYKKCIAALEFHHKDPTEKDFAISSRSVLGIDKVIKEVDKCVLLCSNCHREEHEKQRSESSMARTFA